jgi:hypothetical protein
MRKVLMGVVVLAVAAPLAAQGQGAVQSLKHQGAWLQTAPAYAITPDNPWTVMIFNADGSFCGGSAKDKRYAEGEYAFDGERLTTISSSSGRLSERTVTFRGRDAIWDDPQSAEPVVMMRTDMFADCAALKAHQGQ